MRTALNLTALCALASLAACNFDRIDGAIQIDVTGMPESAVRATVVITDANSSTLTRNPTFGTGVYLQQPLIVTLPSVAPGPYTVQVTAYDACATPLAVGNGAGTYAVAANPDTALVPLAVQLSSNGLQGTYGTSCIDTGTGTNACACGLTCQQYSATDPGICTHACNGNTTCESTPAGATCEAFEGVAANTFCQWECGLESDGGTVCPPGLACGPAVAMSGGKRFCQGTATQ